MLSRWSPLVLAPLVAASLVVPVRTATAAAPAAGPGGGSGGPPAGSVTLITGDRVTVGNRPGGSVDVRVQPGRGRGHITFAKLTGGRHIRVIPSDAMNAVARKRVDARLFDIAYLLREGYSDTRTWDIPLIVTPARSVKAPIRIAGARVTANLSSIGAAAVTVRKANAHQAWGAMESSGDTVRLDAKVRATLDKSVRQIGAPQAWRAGKTGKGVTVAVLDTGYDDQHPDLKGVVKAAKDFSQSRSGTKDMVGHGTHVSSIAAGRGTASRGKYTGVAKGASLVEGKVLGDNGYGLESWVIAGMQWAATQARARVINMSLGASDGPGIDPVEAAVNRLTAQTGALFVVAAGNDGPQSGTLGSPGGADAALAVAAVDRNDRLAEFSSRGPRVGDFALKPDIAAPGVGIAAARSKGSTIGQPVGPHYQRLDGTSMATPHVAGAAAILAQQHPRWSAGQLKAALMGSAKPLPNAIPYTVGTGRVDIARAIRQQVTTEVPSVDFGYLKWPNTELPPASKAVSYRNDSAAPVTLRLSVQGRAGLFSLDRSELTVPAHGTARVTATMTPRGVPAGTYGGQLTATSVDGKTAIQTALGVYKEPESYDLKVNLLDRDGKPPAPNAEVNDVEVFDRGSGDIYFDASGTTFRLRAGRYAVVGIVSTPRPGQPYPAVASLAYPELKLKKNTTVTLDSRTARRVQVTADRPAGRAEWTLHTLIKAPPGAGYSYFDFGMGLAHGMEAYAGTAFPSPIYAFAAQARITEPLIRLDVTAPQAFPVDVVYAEGRNDDDKSPKLLGTRRFGVVYGGKGTPNELRRARGKLVVLALSPQEAGRTPERVRNVKRAGGRAVLLPGSWRQLPQFAGDLAVPTLFAYLPTGQRLAELAKRGPVAATTRGITTSPYQYNLFYPTQGRVPERPIYHARAQDLGAVQVSYRGTGARQIANLSTGIFALGRDFGDGWSILIPAPAKRTEYFSTGPVAFSRSIGGYWAGWPDVVTTRRSYRPGEKLTEVVHKGVIGPTFATPPPQFERPGWAYRQGDQVDVQVPMFTGNQPGQFALAENFLNRTTGSVTLYRGGKQIGHSKEPGIGKFNVPAGAGRYRLDADATCNLRPWQISKTVKASWTFSSAHAGSAVVLPLMAVRYNPGLDDYNRAPAGRLFSFPVRTEPVKAKSLVVKASFDDGKTWRTIPLRANGGQWIATVRNPARGYVSLRAIGKDANGNTVDQTILRAYALRT